MDTSRIDIEKALRRSAITPKGLELIRRVRARTGPVRRVRGGRGVMNQFPLRCSGKAVMLESGQETARVMQLDALATTLEIWEQPCRLSFSVTPGMSKAIDVQDTLDLLVIEEACATEDGDAIARARLEHVTTWKEFESKVRENGDRYYVDEAGRPRDRYLEEYCWQEFGLEMRIVTRKDIPVKVQMNESHLRDLRLRPIEIDAELRKSVREVIAAYPGMIGTPLLETLRERGYAVEPIHLDQLTIDGDLWFDEARDHIKDLDKVRFFPGRASGLAVYAQLDQPTQPIDTGDLDLSIGAQFKWGQQVYMIMNVSAGQVTTRVNDQLLPPIPVAELERLFRDGHLIGQARATDPTMDAVAHMSPAARRRFERRAERMRRSLLTGKKDRTLRRIEREHERLASLEGNGMRALVPNFAASGRRGPRIGEDDRSLALRVAQEQLLTPGDRSLRFTWRAYCRAFDLEIQNEAPERRPMSWPTFRKLVQSTWTKDQIARARRGYKAANADAMRSPLGGGLGAYQGVALASRPWELGHIDDTLIDLWVKDENGGLERCRLRWTLAVDECSGKTIADVLSYDDPSRRSAMQIHRETARKHGRMFEALMTDNASYLTSLDHRVFAAAKGIQLRRRPPGHARYGSRVEAKFKRLNELFHNLLGGNVPNQNPRSLDADLAPEKLAAHTFREIRAACTEALRILDEERDPVTGKSPQQIFDEGMARIGDRPFRRVVLDLPFKVLTSLRRPRKIKVEAQGIRVGAGDVYYWCEAFRDPAVEGTRVEVCDELYDISTKFVLVQGKWHVARSERWRELEGMTEAEGQVTYEEATRRLRREPTQHEFIDLVLRVQSEAKRRANEERAGRREITVTAPVVTVAEATDDVFAAAVEALGHEAPVDADGGLR